jgi:hypothetical protein
MSFEQHPIVAAHLDKLEGRELNIVNFQVFLLEKLSRALYEELVKYQEQEALRQTQIDPLSKAKTEILFELRQAVTQRDLEAVSVLSAAIQRLH